MQRKLRCLQRERSQPMSKKQINYRNCGLSLAIFNEHPTTRTGRVQCWAVSDSYCPSLVVLPRVLSCDLQLLTFTLASVC